MKSLSAALAGVSLVALSVFAATPALAAGNAVDPGDAMYAINCDSVYNDWQLFGVDSTTAFSTAIGTGTGVYTGTCAGQPAYNPATGVSYYIQWFDESDELASIDVATGVSTTIGEFVWENGEFPQTVQADAMAIAADGTAYLLGEGELWALDLSDGSIEPIGESLIDTYALAVDPVTGTLYGITSNNDIYEIDPATGAVSLVDTIAFPSKGHYVYSLQFDQAGTFWIEADEVGESYVANLWSFTLATVDAPVLSGAFTDGPFYTEALLIIPATPKVVLADTGVDSSGVPLVAGIAGMVVLAGAAAMIVRRRRTA